MEKSRANVLITGFGPFPGVPVNASTDLVKHLAQMARHRFPHHGIFPDILDTEWERAPQRIDGLIRFLKPTLVLHFGVARDAHGFRIERQAINSCIISPDAAGTLPKTSELIYGAAACHVVTIPAEQITAHLTAKGFQAHISDDAGAYLCNAVLYQSLATCATLLPDTRVGFIHIPANLSVPPLDFAAALAGSLEILDFCLV